jgi:hypothetical protein
MKPPSLKYTQKYRGKGRRRMAWTREEIRGVIWYYMFCKKYFTDNCKKVYHGISITCAIKYNQRIAATLSTLGAWFVSGI